MTQQTQGSFDRTEFAGKRALVTGGTQGIGEAIVRRLSAAGAMVATTARSPLPAGQSVRVFVQADLSTPEGVAKVAREVLDRLGGLDILVSNVGGSTAPSGGVLALTDDDWRRALDTNLLGAVRLDRALPSGNAAAGVGSHHPCLVHSATLAAVRGDPCVCGRQGGVDELQQGAVEIVPGHGPVGDRARRLFQ